MNLFLPKMKKSSKKNYFTKETEAYIVKYNQSTDSVEREKIFTEHIYYPFYKLVFFLFFRKNTDSSTGRPSGQMPGQTQDSRITASGTTTVGMTTEELDLDNLDTKLYVEA